MYFLPLFRGFVCELSFHLTSTRRRKDVDYPNNPNRTCAREHRYVVQCFQVNGTCTACSDQARPHRPFRLVFSPTFERKCGGRRQKMDWHSDPLLSIPGHSTLFVDRVCCSRWKLRTKNNFFCYDLFPSSLYSLKRRCEKPTQILRHRSAWERQFNDTEFKRTLFLHCWQQKVDIVRVLFTLRTDSCQFDWFQGLMRWVKFSRTVQVIQAQPDEIRFHWCKIFECLYGHLL